MASQPIRLKHPIVLIHGLGAKNAYGPIDYFYGLPKRLRAARNRVLIANLTAWHTIDHRAQELKKQIDQAFPDEVVNLIGHSMGGLDARYLAECCDFSERIASVTTIGTPNRGTRIADWVIGKIPNQTLDIADRFLKYFQSSAGAFRQISTAYWNETLSLLLVNHPKVAYFSATTVISAPVYKNALPIFWLSHKYLKDMEGDNDGFVTLQSAHWGNHICTYQGDHYGQIGQFMGRARGCEYTRFFDEIFRRLKKEGF